jgi:phenylalanyl-tRNA synthetase alpha chain
MQIQDIENQFSTVTSLMQLEELFESLCGKQGTITQQNKLLGALSPDDKKIKGQEIQALRQAAQVAYDKKIDVLREASYHARMDKDLVDFSLIDGEISRGHMHLLQKERRRMEDIMSSL